jgi:periplasmic protein TonB
MRVIAREHQPANIPVASAAMGPKIVLGFVRDESGIFARRSITFFLVAGLHIALFYALMTGLTFKIIKVIPTAFHARILQQPPARTLPPLPPPQLTRPILDIQRPEFPSTESPLEDGDLVAEVRSTGASPPETPTSIISHDVVHVQGGPGSGFPTTDDYYPSIAKRMEEQGVAAVHVCVGADGRLTAVPTIAQSSGSPRLDDGALLLAKAGSGHYRASTEDGRAVSSCYSFRVRFALR